MTRHTLWSCDRCGTATEDAANWITAQLAARHDEGGPCRDLCASCAPVLELFLTGASLDEQAAIRRYEAAEAALAELHAFVAAELDSNPSPWADYYSDPVAQALAVRLEQDHRQRDADSSPSGAMT